MLSVCIPIYNFNPSKLIGSLINQKKVLNIPIEIIVIDDASSKLNLETLNTFNGDCSLYLLPKNIGRAKIRNHFLHYVKYEHLLFLDGDVGILQSNFISIYLEYIQKHPQTCIFGGREYPKKVSHKNQLLRHKYGVKYECKTVEHRNNNPYLAFQSNNFVVPKEVLQQFPFEESITQYGHEDTLFALNLQQHQIPILHINNPVLNEDIEETKCFIIKTEQALQNLHKLSLNSNYQHIITQVRIVKTIQKHAYIQKPAAFLFVLLGKFLKTTLNSFPSLALFNLYKLCYYCSLKLKN